MKNNLLGFVRNKLKSVLFAAGASVAFGGMLFAGGASVANERELPQSALSRLHAEDNMGWKVKWDKKTSVARRLFDAKSNPFPGKPLDAANAFLSAYHELFGLPSDLGNLQFKEGVKTPLGERVTFRQYYQQIPVMGAGVAVHVSGINSIFLVENRCIPDIQTDTQPLVWKDDAVSTSRRALAVSEDAVKRETSELVILPGVSGHHLAWRIIVTKKSLIDRTWLVYVDAKKRGLVLLKKKLQNSATGTGTVYEENPTTTPELSIVTLNNLAGNSSLLEGDYGKTYNADETKTLYELYYSGSICNLCGFSTVSSENRDYSCVSDDNNLTEVMVYYHINRMHDTLKSTFGFSSLDDQMPLVVNMQDWWDPGVGYDNAYYTRDDSFPTGYLLFGTGDTYNNFGQDADVITHEYGHAVLDHIQPELNETYEHNYVGAIHESAADTMSSYFCGNGVLGEWAGITKDGSSYYIRNMDNTRKYPDDVIDPDWGESEVHYTGEILNGVYWDLKDAMGTETAFGLFFSALNLLPGDANFYDMKDAYLTADENAYSGANADAIKAAFAGHGIEGDDLGNNPTWDVKLVFATFDEETYEYKKKKSFKASDSVYILLEANISNVNPAYNLIVDDISFFKKGKDITEKAWFWSYLNAVEVSEGEYDYTVAEVFDFDSKGKIKAKLKVRMGGTDTVKTLRGSFKIE